MIKTEISDGGGGKQKAIVTPDGGLLVSVSQCPPLLKSKCKTFAQKFTTDGTPTGTSDLGVNGSVTPVNYYIESDGENDIYIGVIGFILGYGSSAELFEFADSGAALTNGIEVSYTDSNGIKTILINPKANYSFQRASLAPVSSTNWESRGFAAAGDYGFFVTIPIKDMVPPYGIKLDHKSKQRFSILIRDDCSDADLFNCQAFGFERFE